jgi:hypothetical protein
MMSAIEILAIASQSTASDNSKSRLVNAYHRQPSRYYLGEFTQPPALSTVPPLPQAVEAAQNLNSLAYKSLVFVPGK